MWQGCMTSRISLDLQTDFFYVFVSFWVLGTYFLGLSFGVEVISCLLKLS